MARRTSAAITRSTARSTSSARFSFAKSIKVTSRSRAQEDDIYLQKGVYAGAILRKHTIYMKGRPIYAPYDCQRCIAADARCSGLADQRCGRCKYMRQMCTNFPVKKKKLVEKTIRQTDVIGGSEGDHVELEEQVAAEADGSRKRTSSVEGMASEKVKGGKRMLVRVVISKRAKSGVQSDLSTSKVSTPAGTTDAQQAQELPNIEETFSRGLISQGDDEDETVKRLILDSVETSSSAPEDESTVAMEEDNDESEADSFKHRFNPGDFVEEEYESIAGDLEQNNSQDDPSTEGEIKRKQGVLDALEAAAAEIRSELVRLKASTVSVGK